MCTPNYIRSDSPITDLSFYSLRLNSNIPTTYATTRPFGFQPFSPGPSFFPQKRALVSPVAAARAVSEAVRSLQRNAPQPSPPPAPKAPPQDFQLRLQDASPPLSSIPTSNGSLSERSFGSGSGSGCGSDSSDSFTGGRPFFRAHGIRLPRLKSVSSASSISREPSVGPVTAANAGASYPHSKLDLLVQTATASAPSNSLEPMLPPFLGYKGPAGYPAQIPRPPSLCSSHSSSASIPPAPRTPTGASGANGAHLGPARNLIDNSAAYAKERSADALEHAHQHHHHHHHHVHVHHHADEACTNSSNAESRKRKHEFIDETASSSVPASIKLASPSTSTKRQRSGPSCDCCRSRKIKCDSEIVILAHLPEGLSTEAAEGSRKSQIAHCEWITTDFDTGYQYFKIVRPKDWEAAPSSSRRAKLGSFNYLKFKPCSACKSKSLECQFSKGFTRNDIIKFNKCQRERSSSLGRSGSDSSSSERHTALPPADSRRHAGETSARRRSSSTHGLRASKKTSCRICRFKKIKCIKINGSSSCLNCTRKLLECSYD